MPTPKLEAFALYLLIGPDIAGQSPERHLIHAGLGNPPRRQDAKAPSVYRLMVRIICGPQGGLVHPRKIAAD
jgi:hypothetical protein